jgi:hypothetical protein
MMRCTSTGTGWRSSLLMCGALACGGSESQGTLFEPLMAPGEVKDVPPEAPTPVQPVEVPSNTPGSGGSEATLPGMLSPGNNLPPDAVGTGCRPALGVSGAPTNISEAIILLNTLPKPTSLACFLEALERPLTVYMTKSPNSLQPAPGARSPRTFILRGDFEMSIVFEGEASNTLEFGFRPTPSRSIKTEIVFPVARDVSEDTIFSRIQVTPRTTICGACHVGEEHRDFPGFPSGVFESDVFPPYDFEEVSVDSLRPEAESCDEAAEPYRCELLAALFDHGELVQGKLRGLEE